MWKKLKKRVRKIRENLSNQTKPYLGICHPEWIGVGNATRDIFKENVLEIREQYTKKESEMIANEINQSGKKMVVFNAFAFGWENIIKSLKVTGGCNGNLKGICSILRNKTVDEVIEAFEGINCGPRPTSCPDQIACGLKKYKESL